MAPFRTHSSGDRGSGMMNHNSVPAVAADDNGLMNFDRDIVQEESTNAYTNNNRNNIPTESVQEQLSKRRSGSGGLPPSGMSSASKLSRVWDRRRRRLEKKNRVDNYAQNADDEPDKDLGEMKKTRRSRSDSRRSQASTQPASGDPEFDEDLDPYDSDPGESYRQHCLRVAAQSTKSCLSVPKFLKNSSKQLQRGSEGGETVLTAPPSPMASELGDLFGHLPASLPPNTQRVRYSLRSSITDGSEKQPLGPSVMERRELRPNNVHLNVSHWSDTGGRPYMEDR